MEMMGIIFSNIYDEHLGEITKHRTLASLPFGGRYRLIDFVLSNMVNSGITNVGVITKSNYQSLMDHLGKGKEWDLDRKIDGLFILPPFGTGQKSVYKDKIEALWGTRRYLERSNEEYVLMSDSNVICSVDFSEVLKKHIAGGADITMITRREEIADKTDMKELVVKTNTRRKVADVLVNYNQPGVVQCSLGMYLLKRELLLALLEEANSYNLVDFNRDIIQAKHKLLKIMSCELNDPVLRIDSTQRYFEANMALLDKKTRNVIFNTNGYVYTKIRDEVPTFYGERSMLKNSLIADGCRIEGEVENSILFRGVTVAEGAVVRNSVLMQDTHVGREVELDYIIADKEVEITEGRMLMGAPRHQMIISKGKIV